MSKVAALQAPNARPAEKAPTKPWTFDETFDIVEAIPPAPAATRERSPIITKFFVPAGPKVLADGKHAHKFIPQGYFLDRSPAGTTVEKITGAYMKDKVRAQYKRWAEKDLTQEQAKKLALVLIERKGDEPEYKDNPGISVFLTVKG